MRLKIFTLLIFVVIFSMQQVYTQDINTNQLNTLNIDELSDEQISIYWDKAKAEGYSLQQLEIVIPNKPKQDTRTIQEIIAFTTGISTLGILIYSLVR
jgi:hypothetical protein